MRAAARPFVDYKVYILSPEWRARAYAAKRAAGWRCRVCGAHSVPLEVHHRDYVNLGRETDADLIACCRDCHQGIEDFLAERRGKRRTTIAA